MSAADVLAHRRAPKLHRERCSRVLRPDIEQRTHVTARARHAPQSALVLYESFEAIGVEGVLSHQVDERSGIDVTRSCAHHEPAERGEPHRRVDAPAVSHRGEAGATAEVGDHGPVAEGIAEGCDRPLVGQAVEAIPAHAGARRDRKRAGDQRQIVVERRVEARDLWEPRERLARNRDSGKRCWLMTRGEDRRSLDVCDHRLVDQGWQPAIRTAVHDAMADRAGSVDTARPK